MAGLSLDGQDYLDARNRNGLVLPFPQGDGFRCYVEDREEHRVKLILESSPETKAVFPHDFRAEIHYVLEWNLLAVYLKLLNTGTTPMPLGFCFRALFPVKFPELAEVEVRAAGLWNPSAGDYIPFGHDILPPCTPEAVLTGLQSPAVIHLPREERQITLAFDENFTRMQLQIDGSADSPHSCAIRSTLCTDDSVRLLPGGQREAVFRLRPQDYS